MQDFLQNRYTPQFQEESDHTKFETLNKENREFVNLYQRKLSDLPILTKIYIYLRNNLVNPIMYSKTRTKLLKMLKEAKQGEVITISSIEEAVTSDVREEIKTGYSTNDRIKEQTGTIKILTKFLSLSYYILLSNPE